MRLDGGCRPHGARHANDLIGCSKNVPDTLVHEIKPYYSVTGRACAFSNPRNDDFFQASLILLKDLL